MARMTLRPTPAYGDGAIPPRMDRMVGMLSDNRRTTAAVSTGKLDTPDKTKTPAARAAASNFTIPATKSDPSAKSM